MASSASPTPPNRIERAHQMYRDGRYREALGFYTEALSLAKTKQQKIALHSNRAACYLKLHDFKKLVVADHDLMKSQCELTETPALCMQCLESDPESKKVDKFGIAMIIVNCMSNNSQTAMSNFTNIVKNITDKDMKMAVTNYCVGKYPEVIGNVSMVNNHLKNREFDQAADALARAIASEHYCFEGISKFKLVFPDLWIYYGIRVYEELSDGVMRMIDHFM